MKYFKLSEFDCKETGENKMCPSFLTLMDTLREEYGKPIHISSGYRSRKHSVEKVKEYAGSHTLGRAADIVVANSTDRYELIKAAYKVGINRIGIGDDFIHVDTANMVDTRYPDAVLWVY